MKQRNVLPHAQFLGETESTSSTGTLAWKWSANPDSHGAAITTTASVLTNCSDAVRAFL